MLKNTFALFVSMVTVLNCSAYANTTNSSEDLYSQCFSGNISWIAAHKRKAHGRHRIDQRRNLSVHDSLPLNTKVLVEDPKTGKACLVKVADHARSSKSRVMQVTRAAAEKLNLLDKGVAYMECTILQN